MPYDKKQALVKQADAKKEKKPWTKKKTIAATIIGVSVISFVIFMIILAGNGLGIIRPIKSTEEEAQVVGSCAGYEVKYEELRYITLLHKASLNAEMGEYDLLSADDKAIYEAELEARVTEDLKSNYTVLALCDVYGIDTDSVAAKNYVQDEIEKLVADKDAFGGDQNKYKEWLAENHLTDSFLRLMYKVNYLETVLLDYFVENKIDIDYEYDEDHPEKLADFVDYVMTSDDWVRTIHIYYPAEHPYSDPGNVPAEILAIDPDYIEKIIQDYDPVSAIEGAYEKLSAEQDDEKRYKAARSAVGSAPITEMSISGNGLYFTYGQMSDAYESAAFALENYGVSEVLELDEGYYIIMRLPLEEADVKKNTQSLLTQYQYAALKKQLDSKEEELSFEGNDYMDSISLIDIK